MALYYRNVEQILPECVCLQGLRFSKNWILLCSSLAAVTLNGLLVSTSLLE